MGHKKELELDQSLSEETDVRVSVYVNDTQRGRVSKSKQIVPNLMYTLLIIKLGNSRVTL